MTEPQSPPPDARRAALKVWLQLLALLVGVGAFGYVMLTLSRAIQHH